MSTSSRLSSQSRRRFLTRFGGATAAALTAGVAGLPSPRLIPTAEAHNEPSAAARRADRAYEIRHNAALQRKKSSLPAQLTNGDEERYPNRIGNYSKALPHNALGEVEPKAYNALLHAMATGKPADFEAVPGAGVGLIEIADPQAPLPFGFTVKQSNPQAAFAFELEGADSHQLGIAAPPAFASEEQAGEMTELYWHALTRDVPFSQYNSDPLVAAAVADLSRFPNFSRASVGTLFRGSTAGDRKGPYLSQFLWKDIPYGVPGAGPPSHNLVQRYPSVVAGDDHLVKYDDWLRIQNGRPYTVRNRYESTPRYIRKGRDLSEHVHWDFTYQAFLNAALILLNFEDAALAGSNPYKNSVKQGGFVTFGAAHVLDMVAKVTNCALKAAWHQKWSVHRRLRPEAYGGNVHNHLTGAATYPIHAKLLNSKAIEKVYSRHGTYLLPVAYPEGCPTHPAYPAGHAVIAGACVTALKALFDESYIIPFPVMATDDGLSLISYRGGLTIGGELNKLAANIAVGRDIAGVHWLSDCVEGLKLGEAVAISILTDTKATLHEQFGNFSLTRFDGTNITV